MKRTIQLGALVILVLVCAQDVHADTGNAQITASSWVWPSFIVIPLFASLALYLTGFLRLRQRSPVSWSHAVWFCTGWLSLFFALVSPIHELSEQLFWVHMTQHEILMLVSAPLIVMGRPLIYLLWALPAKWRLRAGKLGQLPTIKVAWVAISAPITAWLLHALALWLWHAPALFDAAVKSDAVHAAQHVSFFATALLFWWTLIHGHRGRLGYGGSALYVFTTAVHMSLLSALLTFSPSPWYAPYANTVAAWNLTPLQDQQLGGLIMWVPASTVMLAITLVLFSKWLQDSDQRWKYTRTAALIRSSNRLIDEGIK